MKFSRAVKACAVFIALQVVSTSAFALAPDAVDDAFTTVISTVLNADVSTNDQDLDGTTDVYSKLTDPSNGTVTVSANGLIVYTPVTGFIGTDTFTYRVTDGTDFDDATVSVQVTSDYLSTASSHIRTDEDIPVPLNTVSYTHLTLPTKA